MAISRRRFIWAGAIAAMAAGVTVKPNLSTLAQDLLGQSSATSSDPLANYTQATFTQYVNSIFKLYARVPVEVTLVEVQDTLAPNVPREGGRESFALHFRGGSVRLPQDSYVVEHPALGTFTLFLVPSGADQNGAQGFVAIINRLGFAAKTSTPRVPSKSPGKRPATSAPPTGQPEKPTQPNQPVLPETQAPSQKRPKPSRNRKLQAEGFEPLIDY